MSKNNATSSIIIPARMKSSRFPNKPLCLIKNMSMIERIWRIAKQSKLSKLTYIATDSIELKTFCEQFGAEVVLTSASCLTGTDRVAEAAHILKNDMGIDIDIIFNLQGDAVLTPPWIIDSILADMIEHNTPMATPAVLISKSDFTPFVEAKKQGSTSGTCVVFDKQNQALFFSKNIIPSSRTPEVYYPIYRHIGLYAYRQDVLSQLVQLPQTPLEKIEHLEQLRALENQIPIKVVVVDYQNRTHGSVDNPEDVHKIEKIITEQGELI
jgi:3-deoxy-manno-octulosonate cytidylyltransferase (CMP-KDO synthetase)